MLAALGVWLFLLIIILVYAIQYGDARCDMAQQKREAEALRIIKKRG